MRLKKQSGYAVRIVIECAATGDGLTRIAEIARRYQITKHNIAKTVPLLVRSGIIEAVRGRNGGIRLTRPASQITIGEIIRATETTSVVADGLEGAATDRANRSAPRMNRMLDEALEAFISVLDQHTVEEMLSGRSKLEALGVAGAAPESHGGENGQDAPARDNQAAG
jgi:Rrf2 family protein